MEKFIGRLSVTRVIYAGIGAIVLLLLLLWVKNYGKVYVDVLMPGDNLGHIEDFRSVIKLDPVEKDGEIKLKLRSEGPLKVTISGITDSKEFRDDLKNREPDIAVEADGDGYKVKFSVELTEKKPSITFKVMKGDVIGVKR